MLIIWTRIKLKALYFLNRNQAAALAGVSVPAKSRREKSSLVEVTHVTPWFNTPFMFRHVKYIDCSIQNPPGDTTMWRSLSMKSSDGTSVRNYNHSFSCIKLEIKMSSSTFSNCVKFKKPEPLCFLAIMSKADVQRSNSCLKLSPPPCICWGLDITFIYLRASTWTFMWHL